MDALVLAGLSARMTAEAAARDGYAPLALDAFGDLDLRRVAAHWQDIGTPGALRLDAARFLAALADLRERRRPLGWVAGSGFEDQPELLERGAAVLPLIGMGADAVREVRDPRRFFAALDALGIPHPEVRFDAPAQPAGWLRKRGDAAGGWHIAAAAQAAAEPAGPAAYWQREAGGAPMSALFVADGARARIVGFNALIVRPVELDGRRHPHVYCGAIGPVPPAPGVAARLDAALQALARRFALRGLGSLDFLLGDGGEALVLEINPRPSASMALHARALPGGLMRAHVRACLEGLLPAPPAPAAAVQGHEIVYARRALALDAGAVCALARQASTHDLPRAGSRFIPGSPVCSVSAAGRDAGEVRARLVQRRDSVLDFLETCHERGCASPLLPG
ncbi:ATP-grasp domain-containing protein [Caldimonas tepidiphila]|uniref:ATP-grasp domain-containing protein n=1 Tax=Caldimonas tepidiphila TaxID=2315841 RepID=UPI000E5A8EAE|nr:ATP-grasp domain-containing protein [Caldimonas tepidiphila]